ncbi:MAG: sigma 54-interacting transcriptional regulator [Deltaproteobacteria bacterium]|nr:sigma 54-interacting transcriptional regulator [Deltaproteobacteria bacterium]MDH3899091.1 sigma 54-interacting transcriptional regulator [Deltaproteobacteria bacterium]MDH3929486.1 sigma 54-interacting transcriptional regulator [Deltaproteobacteria bacterium]MDH3964885.1 sigma 54-interacting transcriptional regulator [Deltaproteobacteria bacterium]
MDVRLENLLADKMNLQRILDSLMEGIIAHDKERRILFFNRAAEKITGYDREEVLGRDCHDAFGSPFCGGRCSFCGEPPNSWTNVDYPLNLVTKEGSSRRIEMSVTGMTDETGCFTGVLAAFRDVTDLIGLQIRLGQITSFAGIIGQDHKMLQIFEQIRELATNDYPVHIMGETGTGKELVAAAIHNESRRGGGAFVPINCGALPEGVLESELFGHVKGAFSGAIRDKKGRFELADGGTIFLDEVVDLTKSMQVKLLRVLQEGTFERVGGEKTVSVDVRVISAANRDLKREVERKNFREDLYYRLNVVPVELPPLRTRKNDIPLLAEEFLRQASEQGQKTAGLSKKALSMMMDYLWPGNVRELQNALHYALVKCKGRLIRPEDLPMELKSRRSSRRGPTRKLNPEMVQAALDLTGGNKAKAARHLGVGRATLYRFFEEFPDVS